MQTPSKLFSKEKVKYNNKKWRRYAFCSIFIIIKIINLKLTFARGDIHENLRIWHQKLPPIKLNISKKHL